MIILDKVVAHSYMDMHALQLSEVFSEKKRWGRKMRILTKPCNLVIFIYSSLNCVVHREDESVMMQ